MKTTTQIVSAILLIILFTTCKKETYNPEKYDKFLYIKNKEEIKSHHLLKVKIGDELLETYGVANIDSNTITIKGVLGGRKLYIKLVDFKSKTNFNIIQNSPDSASIESSGTLYLPSSLGSLTITKLDTLKKIIEGTFHLELSSTDGTKILLKDGQLKISYSETLMKAVVNTIDHFSADTSWAFIDSSNTVEPTDDKFKVKGRAMLGGIASMILLEFPYSFSEGKYQLSESGPFKAYFTYDINTPLVICRGKATDYVRLKLDENTKTIEGSFNFETKDDNYIKSGRFIVNY